MRYRNVPRWLILLSALLLIGGVLGFNLNLPASGKVNSNGLGGSGTGVLYIYSDSSCTSLLPQAGGVQGYVLPAVGTTVYIQVAGITETGIKTIELLYSGSQSYTEFLSVTVTEGSTNCVPWVVGTFSQGIGIVIDCGVTGVVKYGTSTGPSADEFTTNSNGGSDGGHFFGAGTGSDGTCTSTTTSSSSTTSSIPTTSTTLATSTESSSSTTSSSESSTTVTHTESSSITTSISSSSSESSSESSTTSSSTSSGRSSTDSTQITSSIITTSGSDTTSLTTGGGCNGSCPPEVPEFSGLNGAIIAAALLPLLLLARSRLTRARR